MIDDGRPLVIDRHGGPIGVAAMPTESDPGHTDDKRAHRLEAMIRPHVLDKARRRLASTDAALTMPRLSATKTVEQYKQALYTGTNRADDVGGRQTPITWLARHDAALPRKLSFLEAVARALGDDWSRDHRSFLDVTIGIGRLQVELRRLINASASHAMRRDHGTVLMTSPPGEAHHFGQSILEELFRAFGWSTDILVPDDHDTLMHRLAERGHDIVCLSWSTGALSRIADSTISAIGAIPAATRPAIIAGGVSSMDRAGWLVRLGADCVCDSTYGALSVAHRMLDQRRLLPAISVSAV